MKESTVFCWDCNGTLEEGSEIALTEAINESLEKRGIERRVSTKDVFGFFGADVDKLATHVSGVTIPREELEELTFTKAEKYVKPAEGAEGVLSEVRRRGDMNVVVSGSGERMLKRYLEITGLMPYVNGYIGTDTFQIMYSQIGLDVKSGGVDFEKTNAFFRYANHDYVHRVVVIGDSHLDMRSAYVTNELLHQHGRRRNVRPILFQPLGRRERVRTTLRQMLYDEVLYYVIGHKKAKTLREAMEMGYAEGESSYSRKPPFFTALVSKPHLLPALILSKMWEKQLELYREEPVSLEKS